MLPTLDQLFEDFVDKFGNFTPFPEGGSDPQFGDDFVDKKIDFIEHCLRRIAKPDPSNAFHYPEVWKEFWDGVIDKELTYMSDPLLSLLLVRTADLAIGTPGLGTLWTNQMQTQIERFSSSASLAGIRLHNGFIERFGTPEDPHLQWCLLQVRAYFQYAQFRFMNFKYEDPKHAIQGTEIWNDYRLGDFWDYSKVHPFLRALCPPGQIWDRYLLDAKVCSLISDGTVSEREPNPREFEENPPKLLWSEASGRRA